jgi:hypothetical protein
VEAYTRPGSRRWTCSATSGTVNLPKGAQARVRVFAMPGCYDSCERREKEGARMSQRPRRLTDEPASASTAGHGAGGWVICRPRCGHASLNAVREILINPKYTGYMVWNRRATKTGSGKHNPPSEWVWHSQPAPG